MFRGSFFSVHTVDVRKSTTPLALPRFLVTWMPKHDQLW